MNSKPTKRESEHMARVKQLSCGVCGASGPSEAHHMNQDHAFTVLPLCSDCHRGPHNGIHGEKIMWKIMKVDEMDVLNRTISMLVK